jgi:DNA-binding transcriptional ArsR family regulator
MKSSWSSLAPILRSDVQGRILAVVMVDPETEHSLTDLARQVGTSQPTVLREIDRAEQAGIVTTRKQGQVRLVRANLSNPLYEPLAKIVITTYGPPAVLVDVLADIEDIDEAYLFGSWAARYQGAAGHWPNDIDVLVIGQPDRDEIYEAAEQAERRLGLPVQITLRTPAQWHDGDDAFVAEVKSRHLVNLSGNDEGEES